MCIRKNVLCMYMCMFFNIKIRTCMLAVHNFRSSCLHFRDAMLHQRVMDTHLAIQFVHIDRYIIVHLFTYNKLSIAIQLSKCMYVYFLCIICYTSLKLLEIINPTDVCMYHLEKIQKKANYRKMTLSPQSKNNNKQNK